jgi:amidase
MESCIFVLHLALADDW